MKLIIFLGLLFTIQIISVTADIGNNTSDQPNTESDLVIATWVLAGGTIAVGIGTIIALFKTHYHQKNQDQISALMEIFKTISDEEHRNARRITYRAKNEYEKKQKDITVFRREEYYKAISGTASHFNQIGILIQKEIIPEEEFLDLYADTVIYCWKSLQEHIENEQNIRKNNSYMNYFEWLGEQAEKYWLKNHPDEKLPEPYLD